MDEPERNALESVEFLAASPVRLRILNALADGPAEPSRLEERLDVPRSTLRRNLSELVDRSYVARAATRSEYELTDVGVIVRDAVRDLASTVAAADSAIPFLRRFPVDIPVPTETVLSCDVTTIAAETPFDPISVVKDRIVSGKSVRGFLPVINPILLDSLESIVDRGVSVSAIAPSSAYEPLEANFGEAFDAVASASNVHLYVSDDVPEYSVGFVDETALLGAFDEHMRTHSVLQATAESPVYEWALEQYERVERTAAPYGGDTRG